MGNTALPIRLAVCVFSASLVLACACSPVSAAGLKRVARSETAPVQGAPVSATPAPMVAQPVVSASSTRGLGVEAVARVEVSGPMSSGSLSVGGTVPGGVAAPTRITPQTQADGGITPVSSSGNGTGVVVVRGPASAAALAAPFVAPGPIVITSTPSSAPQAVGSVVVPAEPAAGAGELLGPGVTSVRRIASSDTAGTERATTKGSGPSEPAPRITPAAPSPVAERPDSAGLGRREDAAGVRPVGAVPGAAAGDEGQAVETMGNVPRAQGGEGLRLTVRDAAALAVKNSLDMEIQATNIRQAQAQVRKAFGLDDFTLTAGATFGRRGPIASMKLPGEGGGDGTTIKLGTPDINTQQLQLVKPLFSDGQIERAQQVAMRSLDVARLSRDVVSRALDLAARQACYNVLRTEQLADVAQQQAVAVAAHLDQSRKLADAGVVPKFEVIQAQTELAKAQGNVISARTTVETATAALKRLLTLTQDTALQVSAGPEEAVPEGDRDKLVAQAYESRPEIRAAEAAVQLADANLKLAKSTSGLTVALAAGVTKTKATFGSEPTNWQVAVSAQKPIFDGQARDSAVREAQSKLDAAKLSLEKTKQDIALEVTQSLMNLEDARERLRVAQQGVANAEEQLRVAKVRFESGIALGVEVIDAETALTAAKAEVVNAQYGVQLATAQLRSAVGLWSGNEGGSKQ